MFLCVWYYIRTFSDCMCLLKCDRSLLILGTLSLVMCFSSADTDKSCRSGEGGHQRDRGRREGVPSNVEGELEGRCTEQC